MKCSRCGCTVFHENELDKMNCENVSSDITKTAKEEFEKYCKKEYGHILGSEFKHTYLAGYQKAWEKALKRSNEIAERDGADYSKLHAENQKLRECVEFYADFKFVNSEVNERMFAPGFILGFKNRAFQCLKELEE